ncbi:hypothetical protein [Candidatus Enterococcus ferrettii]|uniref:Uncharacterized protein n=1 Tax=Candidatus Enterococcus ferrettii TaxID=2815324 RepID=A0ABV0EQ30_9ENTE|nr:hypothetical protein [Enterococcus sp. 665A]MBO1341143.1 hypothetical protein [Enterococcus sp. 665A]
MQESKELPAKNLPDQTVTVNEQQIQLKNIRLSPISISFDHTGSLNDASIEIVLTDGTIKKLTVEYQEKDDSYEWQFGLINLDVVESVKISDQQLQLD